ncbi:KN motif and ankyrin repeat domain-containing protein 1-like isoform X3 [Branchiostoma lanceolatum]|uniref:KN motif and ankyrin repeat domain-containing protein 1-like isoform X3 n=1 Tax=Branchiostoma lanceolatum TaxID=7740 RepID=UPI0034557F70
MRKATSTVDYATMRDKDVEKPADAESGFGDMESDTPEANPKVDLSPDGKCTCCPYGYHIDLDFLKYCDDITKGSNIPKIVRPRKPKSPGGPPAMDYRANTLPRGFYLNSQQSGLPRHTSVVPPSPISPLSVNTSLSSANNSIPETTTATTMKQTVPDPRENASSVYGYNSSTRRPSLPGDLPIPFTSPNSNSVFTMPAALANQSNSGSSSSLSSQLSTQSSSGQFSPHSEMSAGETKHSLGVQTPASLLSPGSSSRGSGASTPQPSVNSAMLQGIREQIAASLKRIKVLEEQVKEIPVLQVKISVLKEEKRLLVMQLKSKNGEQNLKPEDTNRREKRDDDKDGTKRLHRRSLSTGSFQMLEQQWKEQQAEQGKQKACKDAPEPSEKNGAGKKPKVPPPVPPRSFRSVSVGDTTSLSDIVCYNSALRTSVDAGTNTTVPSRDIGVGYSPLMRHVGVGISNDLLQQELGIVENQCNTAAVETSEVGVGVSVEQRAVAVGNHTESRDVGMTTEPEVVKKQKTKHATRSIGVIVDIPETKDVRTVGVGNGSVSEQQKPLAETVSVSTNTPVINTIDKVTNTVAVNLKTVAVGNFSVKDLLCDRCADVKTKTVAVGACSIKDTICDRCNNMESKTVGVGRCTINDTVCDKCSNLKTRSIGCATLANWNQKSVSVLAKVEQSDASTGDDSVIEETDSGKDQTETKDIGVGEDSVFPLEDVKLPVQMQEEKTVNVVSSVTAARPPLEIVESSSSDEVEDEEDMIPPLQQASIIKTTEPQVAEVQPVRQVVRETVVRETVVTVRPQDGYEELDGEVKDKKEEDEEKESLEAGDGFENKHALSPGSSPAISNLRPLRSCLKGKHSTKKVNIKKEIQFVGVNGNGHDESSSEDSSSEESSEDETDDEDSSSSEEESSDEGGYNCELGKVIKKGKEDQGKKGVKTISSSEIICEDIKETDLLVSRELKETYELSEELQEACGVLEKHVTTPKSVPPRELMMAMNTIQQEWMKAGAQKTSDVHVVRDYLAAFQQMASGVLAKIVNLADGNGNTALHYSVSHSNFDIVEILLETGQCEVNKQNKAGYTAIMLASLAKLQGDRQMEVVKKLFQSGDVNIRATQAGQTALMLAVSHGRQEIVKMLIDAGAEVNLQDEDDSTALSIAMEAGHRDIGVLLYAQVNMGKTAPGGGKGRRLSPSPTRRKSP